MKRTAKLSFVIVLLLSVSLIVRAQNTPTQLSDVAKALECLDQKKSSLWTLERGEPFGGSKDVLVYKYVSGGRGVLVRFMYYLSDAEANKSFKSFGEYASAHHLKKIQNLGDEAFSWGYDESIVMRKGNLMVYVSAGSDIDRLLPELEAAETSALSRREVELLTRNFARMMNKTLSNLSEACQRPHLYYIF